ncbi:MAG: shikimate dehydrogenase [Bacteroidetes bacterium 24-39-8]|jgi:shikimate dehydrogenase|nr:MAG: shikimate dehydrogenase [Sphingobacteriia bacterium 35-40-8]OYZ48001.1 MAG: shikimate dehydrogenase [Bacteroidetes bacterium 24-39-8]HQS56082.1 shikimate dehydrogenase [Sediminibacterium sp.]
MRLYGLLGYPLSHSFSQKYFTEKFQNLGLQDAAYENFSLPNISELQAILDHREGLEGFNITIPYKKEVLAFLDHASQAVQEIGACNCVRIVNGKRFGYNTDVVGFEQTLAPFLKPHHKKALILGTGGASAAVEWVLKKLGIEYLSVSRTASDNTITYEQIDEAMMTTHSLVINTTPLGMYPKIDACPNLPYQFINEQHHLFDLVYNPEETQFLAKGKAQGASIQNGWEMLILQAEESWRIWNEAI